MIRHYRKGTRWRRILVLCLVMVLSFAGVLSLRTVYAGEIQVVTDSKIKSNNPLNIKLVEARLKFNQESDTADIKLLDLSKKVDSKEEFSNSKEAEPNLIPLEDLESMDTCKMPLEIDPEEWDPTGGNSSYGDIDTDIDEDTEIVNPTHPYAPYEEILENLDTPSEVTNPDSGELIPLTDLEEDILYIEDVIYYEPEKLPTSGVTIEPVLEKSPETGGSRNSTPWFILSILSLLGIISLTVTAKNNN